jgi:hypothetical protein
LPFSGYHGRPVTIILDLAEILGSEKNPTKKVNSNSYIIIVSLDALEACFRHLFLSQDPISPDSFDTLGIKNGLCFVRIFIFKTNVSLLREENARKIHLNTLSLDSAPEREQADLFEFQFNGDRIARTSVSEDIQLPGVVD